MSRHGILRKVALGLSVVAFLGLLLVACTQCSQKIYKNADEDIIVRPQPFDPVEYDRWVRQGGGERQVNPRPPARDQDVHADVPNDGGDVFQGNDGGDVFQGNDGGDGQDLGNRPDIGADDPDADTPVTPSGRGKATRPSAASDFDPFSGEGDDEPAAKPALNADDYKVALDVTNEITLGSNATLRVWIGMENYLPKPIPTTSRETSDIPASLGDYARITPYAPDFTVGPEESQVMRIVPSGSSVLFSLTPEKEGEFLISARIELYDNPDLMGVAVPKTSEIVSIVVKVDTKAAVKSHLGELGSITWSEVKKFWAAIVAVFFGAILFLFRKFVRKKTGYSADGSDYGGSTYTPTEPAQTTDTSASGGDTVDDPFADGADTGGDLADSGDEPEDPFA